MISRDFITQLMPIGRIGWLCCLLFVGLSAGPRAMADSAGIPGGLDGGWIGPYEPTAGAPAVINVRIDTGRTPAQISITIRTLRIGRQQAAGVAVEGNKLSFELKPAEPDRESGLLHFELRHLEPGQPGERLEGTVSEEGSHKPLTVRLTRPYRTKLEEFQPFVGDYRTADGSVYFVGYGEGAPGRGVSQAFFAFVTLDDRMMPIFPVSKTTFLADGAELTFEADKNGRANRLRWKAWGKSPQLAERVELWRAEEIAFDGPGATLSGTLFLPTSQGRHPALVFVHGSGPQTRYPNWWMADRFARAGIACLSFDKRGTGKSTGDWRQAGFDTLADDVVAGVDALRGRPEIRRNKIGLWGVSQAGWVIPIAANKSDHVAFCIPVSGAAVSPAEQELWRRMQALTFRGCDARLQEAMRRGVGMHYQWEELFKAGRFPIPPLFEVEAIDMDLDAPAVLRRVRQPVLAIWGAQDVLTPPRESAAIWRKELQAGGNPDFSIRLFPQATHGLMVSDRPFEMLPEVRLAPGYAQTMIDWIEAHARGKSTQHVLDVASDDVIQSRGLRNLPWYGSAPVQVSLLATGTLGSLWTILVWPAAWAVRRVRKRPRESTRRPIVMAWIVNFVALAMCCALLATLRFLSDALPSPYYNAIKIGLWILAGLALVIGWMAYKLVRASLRAKTEGRSRWQRGSLWIAAVATCVWVPFFLYWTWGPLLG